MKSYFFSTFPFARSQDFSKDVSTLRHVDAKHMDGLDDAVVSLEATRAASTGREYRRRAAEIAKERGISAETITSGVSILAFLLREMMQGGRAEADSAADLAADLVSIGELPKETEPALARLLEKLQAHAKGEYGRGALRRDKAKEGLPAITRVTVVTDSRAVFAGSFEPEQNPKEYEPECVGMVPVAIISLALNGGPVEEVHFQADEDSLRRLTNALEAAEKELDAMKRYHNTRSSR